MKNRILLCSTALSALSANIYAIEKTTIKQDKPNIVCLAFEDMSHYLIGCYGNPLVSTPNIDGLAANGIQYMNAWPTAPQSSPARSSLITGAYATTYGMDVHPVAQKTPEGILFPQLLRNAGYYCTNNSKTHYNTELDNKSCWDESSGNATYNSQSRAENQPFFAVFNSEVTHMGRMRTFHMEGRRNYMDEGIDTSKIIIPPHLPNLPEIRSDFAAHMEAAQDVDQWVGLFIKDLKEKGLDENTIVFVYSDHGGCLPRGKGYLYETGLRIPFIAHFPDKWKHLANEQLGVKSKELVGFVDFAPTILSLAGIEAPDSMQGKPFLGEKKEKPRTIQFAFASNQLHHYMPVRAATDGRYKYIRNYIPYRLTSLRNYYQWAMPSNMAWDDLVLSGENKNTAWDIPFQMQPSELLFDLENDPWEINNLSEKPEYAVILKKKRKEVSENIRETKDLGFFLPSSRKGVNVYQKVRDENYDLNELYQIVELAGLATEKDIPFFTKYLTNKNSDMQFWAIVGLGKLAREGKLSSTPKAIEDLLEANDLYLVAEAAYVCFYAGEKDLAMETLLQTPANESNYKILYSVLECLTKDKSTHVDVLKYKNKIEWAANNLTSLKNEDPGLMAKGILADLGLIKLKDVYKSFHKQGLKFNTKRRISRSAPLSYN